jgi:hypothetical protein
MDAVHYAQHPYQLLFIPFDYDFNRNYALE